LNRETIEGCANFRSKKRIPTVVWFNAQNHSTLSRCSQPLSGLSGWSSMEDSTVVSSLHTHTEGGIHIIDCRSKMAAIANCAKGGGHENTDLYYRSEISFLDIDNIHKMRTSYNRMADLVGRVLPDRQRLETTNWFNYISKILHGGDKVAGLLESGTSVLVHCSDGWDRTTQIISIGQLLSDPFFRTIKGFGILIQKDWLSFGHKFEDRIGQGLPENYDHEQSPIFVQFIEVVYHLTNHYPSAFEFNETYLITLLDHLHSGLFGSFIGNCEKERYVHGVDSNTRSLWTYLSNPSRIHQFINVSYQAEKYNGSIRIFTESSCALNVWLGWWFRFNISIKSLLANQHTNQQHYISLTQKLSMIPELNQALRSNDDCSINVQVDMEEGEEPLQLIITIKGHKVTEIAPLVKSWENIVSEVYRPTKKNFQIDTTDKPIRIQLQVEDNSSSDEEDQQQQSGNSILSYFSFQQ